MMSRLLNKFAKWALSQNPPGGYEGEDDKRWAYTIATNGDPYLTRILFSKLVPFKKFLGFGVYLHHFHRPDIDQHLHNHPWKWAFSIILSGSYDESRLNPDGYYSSGRIMWDGTPVIRRVVKWFNAIHEDDYHKVTKLNGDVWTLFVTGPQHGRDWGFLVDGKHVPQRVYLGKEEA